MKIHKKLKRGFTLVELLVVIVIIAALAGLAAPQILKMRNRAEVAEAINNGKNLALALTMFQADYNGFPDDGTAVQVAAISGFEASTLGGDDSNGFFRQLLASGVTDSEQPFFMKSIISPRKPDNNSVDATEALKAGEVGFGYIMQSGGEDAGNSAIPQRGSLPIAAGPFADADKFDPDQFSRRAIVVFVDNSVQELSIGTTGEGDAATTAPIFPSGKTLIETGADTVWGASITPEIIAPAIAGGAEPPPAGP